MTTVIGIDVGGSGSRLAMVNTQDATSPTRYEIGGGRVSVTSTGSNLVSVVEALLRTAAHDCTEQVPHVQAIGLGATGLATLVSDHHGVLAEIRRLAREYGIGEKTLRTVAAIDAVTAHLGALNGGSGAMVALGTGAIALGGDGHGSWHRVDGWGHLFGDRGSGAAIGRVGLAAALESFDGVNAAGDALLTAARQRFGDPYGWPAQFYTRNDRAGVLASFVPDVVALATHDAMARSILQQAGTDAARSALAALRSDYAPRVALTGGVANSKDVTTAFTQTVTALRPEVEVIAALGDPLAGAILLAAKAHQQQLSASDGYVWL